MLLCLWTYMVELAATLVIITSSILLFAYWFRYTCLLIVSAKTVRDYASQVAMANQLSFLQVQAQLSDTATANLDRLRDLLDRDYAVVTGLMAQAAAGGAGFEQQVLAINYRVTRAWFGVSSQFSPRAARQALEQMSQVVSHFANSVGECAASAA
jgi:hypothetical protein